VDERPNRHNMVVYVRRASRERSERTRAKWAFVSPASEASARERSKRKRRLSARAREGTPLAQRRHASEEVVGTPLAQEKARKRRGRWHSARAEKARTRRGRWHSARAREGGCWCAREQAGPALQLLFCGRSGQNLGLSGGDPPNPPRSIASLGCQHPLPTNARTGTT
jgi:hypothetical protein